MIKVVWEDESCKHFSVYLIGMLVSFGAVVRVGYSTKNFDTRVS